MSETKLKPCPFCGGEADLIEQKHREYASTYYVRCKGCHCKSIERIGVGIVVEAWNTRKPIDDIVAELERFSLDTTPYCNAMDGNLCDGMSDCDFCKIQRAIDIVRNAGKECAE